MRGRILCLGAGARGQRLSLRVKRGQSDLYLEVTPEAVATSEGTIGRIGVALGPQQWPSSMQRLTRAPFYTAWLPALDKTFEMTRFTFESIGKMVQGLVSTRNLSGPITIAKIANQTAGNGLESFLGFIALVSISLGGAEFITHSDARWWPSLVLSH